MISRFESFIERFMERAFTRAAHSKLQPIEIGKRLVRAMEREQSVGVGGVMVPNVYEVHLSRDDYDHFAAARSSHEKYLESHLARVARQRRFVTVSRPVVRLRSEPTLPAGEMRIATYVEDAREASGDDFQHTQLLPRMDGVMRGGPSTPNIVWNGTSHAVLNSPTRVGRLRDNDIVLDDRRVSRYHAIFEERNGRWMLKDTGSTNGTAVNGKVTKESVLKPGDVISLGGLEVTWEQ